MTEETLFELARKTPVSERSALLDRACEGKPELRARVEALLQADAGSSPFSDPSFTIDATTGFQATASYTSPELEPSNVIAGRYTLEQKLGEGGMGEVWVAKQWEPVKRKVALKLIKAGMDSKSVVQRFEQERQALAMMDHPNIAKVLDGGITEQRQPFFVMELVNGLPLNKFCDEAKLSIQERLELFVPICQAVQHAHQKGIVHRDLKPSNILVTMIDGKPIPKVIDFGVAKATGGKLTDESMSTQFGAVIGTLEYMSPEQAGFSNQDVDTRADIYSLGVILYELLTGLRPFDSKRLKQAALDEVIRIIREEEPSKPSTKLSTDEALPSLAAVRHIEPGKLTALLRGELDWVVMKCLEKQRDRRYETANGLARDIQRYLADEPVEARPPSARYLLKKFIERNRGTVIAAILVFFALVAGIAGTTWGLIEAKKQADLAIKESRQKELARQAEAELRIETLRERDEKETARQKAIRERNSANAIAEFVRDDFLALTSIEGQIRFGDPAIEPLNKNTTLQQLLDRAASKLDKRRDLVPHIEADLRWMVGLNYRGIGEPAKGIPHLERSVALFKSEAGEDHEKTLMAQNSLAVCYSAAGKLDQAVKLGEIILQVEKAKLGLDHPHTLGSMSSLARYYMNAGKLDLAIPLIEHVFKVRTAKLGDDHPDTLRSATRLATAYQQAGKLEKALSLYKQTLKFRTVKLGENHAEVTESMHQMAEGYRAMGKFALAEPLFEKALQAQTNTLGADHPDTLRTMNNLALCYRETGKLEQAITLQDQALKQFKAKLGADHPDTLRCMGNLATSYKVAGKLDHAMPLYEQTYNMMKLKLGANHPNTITSMVHLSEGFKAARKFEQALLILEQAVKLRKTKLGEGHPDTLNAMGNLGKTYCLAKQGEKAAVVLRELVALNRRLYPGNDSSLAGLLINIAQDLQECGQYRDAEPMIRESLAIRQKIEPDNWITFNTQSMLGRVLLLQKKYAEAEPLLIKGYEEMVARLPQDAPGADAARLAQNKSLRTTMQTRIAEALDRLIQFYTETNKPDEVKKWQAEREKLPKPAPDKK
ncbi:MAG: serine/threonine protein kinase [Planctomycetia bacterium]|nr:serine/threonine protein kinase [Planctomycetia bacterium]